MFCMYLKQFWILLLLEYSITNCVKLVDAAAAAKSLQSCPTLCDPIDGSPPGSPRPWDSPGKNTGVGCHFLLQCMKVKSESEVVQSCPTSQLHGLQPTRLLRPWDFPGKSTGVGCHCLLRSCASAAVAAAAKLLQSCQTLCNSIDGSPPGSPIPGILHARTLEWVAIAFFNA